MACTCSSQIANCSKTLLLIGLLDNLTRTMDRVGVAYGSPCKQIHALLSKAVTEQEDVLRDPPPVVLFEDVGDSTLIFEAYF
jgi:small-conductance mechanosensitive channel